MSENKLQLTFGCAEAHEKETIFALYQSMIGRPGCTWSDEYPTWDLLEEDFNAKNLFVARLPDNMIVGALSICLDPEVTNLDCWDKTLDPIIELARVVVRTDYQNNGICAFMLMNLLELLPKRGYAGIHFLVSKTNPKAIHAYEKFHFSVVGESQILDNDWWCYEKDLR